MAHVGLAPTPAPTAVLVPDPSHDRKGEERKEGGEGREGGGWWEEEEEEGEEVGGRRWEAW